MSTSNYKSILMKLKMKKKIKNNKIHQFRSNSFLNKNTQEHNHKFKHQAQEHQAQTRTKLKKHKLKFKH